jgi:FkbM family methyltransferase
MDNLLRRLASQLPLRIQQEMKRLRFAYQIRKNHFNTVEPEFLQLQHWICKGDWVIDIGANIGHYTLRLSELVGEGGRVIAIEPVTETFELLAANVTIRRIRNVTLLNIGASDVPKISGMAMPKFDTGLSNYYRAYLTDKAPTLEVFCMPIDLLHLPHRISLIKIDTEGHDYYVLKGIKNLLERDHPILIVEGDSPMVIAYLKEFGYEYHKNIGSPNLVFELHEKQQST